MIDRRCRVRRPRPARPAAGPAGPTGCSAPSRCRIRDDVVLHGLGGDEQPPARPRGRSAPRRSAPPPPAPAGSAARRRASAPRPSRTGSAADGAPLPSSVGQRAGALQQRSCGPARRSRASLPARPAATRPRSARPRASRSAAVIRSGASTSSLSTRSQERPARASASASRLAGAAATRALACGPRLGRIPHQDRGLQPAPVHRGRPDVRIAQPASSAAAADRYGASVAQQVQLGRPDDELAQRQQAEQVDRVPQERLPRGAPSRPASRRGRCCGGRPPSPGRARTARRGARSRARRPPAPRRGAPARRRGDHAASPPSRAGAGAGAGPADRRAPWPAPGSAPIRPSRTRRCAARPARTAPPGCRASAPSGPTGSSSAIDRARVDREPVTTTSQGPVSREPSTPCAARATAPDRSAGRPLCGPFGRAQDGRGGVAVAGGDQRQRQGAGVLAARRRGTARCSGRGSPAGRAPRRPPPPPVPGGRLRVLQCGVGVLQGAVGSPTRAAASARRAASVAGREPRGRRQVEQLAGQRGVRGQRGGPVLLQHAAGPVVAHAVGDERPGQLHRLRHPGRAAAPGAGGGATRVTSGGSSASTAGAHQGDQLHPRGAGTRRPAALRPARRPPASCRRGLRPARRGRAGRRRPARGARRVRRPPARPARRRPGRRPRRDLEPDGPAPVRAGSGPPPTGDAAASDAQQRAAPARAGRRSAGDEVDQGRCGGRAQQVGGPPPHRPGRRHGRGRRRGRRRPRRRAAGPAAPAVPESAATVGGRAARGRPEVPASSPTWAASATVRRCASSTTTTRSPVTSDGAAARPQLDDRAAGLPVVPGQCREQQRLPGSAGSLHDDRAVGRHVRPEEHRCRGRRPPGTAGAPACHRARSSGAALCGGGCRRRPFRRRRRRRVGRRLGRPVGVGSGVRCGSGSGVGSGRSGSRGRIGCRVGRGVGGSAGSVRRRVSLPG